MRFYELKFNEDESIVVRGSGLNDAITGEALRRFETRTRRGITITKLTGTTTPYWSIRDSQTNEELAYCTCWLAPFQRSASLRYVDPFA